MFYRTLYNIYGLNQKSPLHYMDWIVAENKITYMKNNSCGFWLSTNVSFWIEYTRVTSFQNMR